MEEDIKVLENMRDNIYGAIQFEDDYQVRITEQKEFDALNLAINHLRKTKLVYSQFIPKSKVKELGEKVHNKLDNNAITRGYQIIIDEMFSKVLEEGE